MKFFIFVISLIISINCFALTGIIHNNNSSHSKKYIEVPVDEFSRYQTLISSKIKKEITQGKTNTLDFLVPKHLENSLSLYFRNFNYKTNYQENTLTVYITQSQFKIIQENIQKEFRIVYFVFSLPFLFLGLLWIKFSNK